MADDTDTPEPAAKPRAPRRRSTTPRKPRATAAKADTPAAKSATPARAKPATPPKPRSTKRATPAPKRRAPAKSTIEKADEKSGGKWGTAAAVVGGIAAVGAAATAALLSLRGSTPKDARPKRGAHTADGTDASKSFEAGIADEGTIPDKF